MIGLLLVTHGELATSFLSALEHVVGKQDQMATICIEADDDIEVRRQELSLKLDQINTGDGVLILTDMFGGTPSNLAISFLKKGKVEAVSGLNLPMLIRLAHYREHESLDDLAAEAKETGKKYISIASELLEKINKNE